MWREGQGKVKARSQRGQGKFKLKSKQRKHNLNRNYNLMGFDTIEINLVSYNMNPKASKHWSKNIVDILKFPINYMEIRILLPSMYLLAFALILIYGILHN